MIEYQRDVQQTIPVEQVKIIGVGGAGANILDRVALDGTDAANMLALNTDSRTLNTSMAGEKIQLGKGLTMGLGSGGDPELGLRAAREVETEIRDSLRNQKIVFICVGLGGGTGSGAAPLITRIAREQGAFVVVFSTIPFDFEGRRRKEQAETALNELSVLANALVTFENAKMGELVLAKQGIHEAFSAADVMISQSIKAVTRLVVKPGLINVGLDDLMAALKATKSRCLFGSGISDGENRSLAALQNALASPLLDKGALLKSATTVLVHICGGPSMSLYEVELLMRELAKQVPESAHILFGAAVDESMADNLSVTLISALPKAMLFAKSDKIVQQAKSSSDDQEQYDASVKDDSTRDDLEKNGIQQGKLADTPEADQGEEMRGKVLSTATTRQGVVVIESSSENLKLEAEPTVEPTIESKVESKVEPKVEPTIESTIESKVEPAIESTIESTVESTVESAVEPTIESIAELEEASLLSDSSKHGEQNRLNSEAADKAHDFSDDQAVEKDLLTPGQQKEIVADQGASTLKPQGELALDGGPKGKFSGEAPNMLDGEDLDIPPFLRNQ